MDARGICIVDAAMRDGLWSLRANVWTLELAGGH